VEEAFVTVLAHMPPSTHTVMGVPVAKIRYFYIRESEVA